MSAPALPTVEQFEQLRQPDGVHYELKGGELLRMANAKFGHQQAKSKLIRVLVAYVLQHPIGDIYSETAFALSESRVCTPDVAFLSKESVAKSDPEHIYRGAPDLAVEIVSESESAEDLRQKIQDYLEAGSTAAWAVYPKLRVVAVYDKAGVREFHGDQILVAPDILPGFQVEARHFFT